MNLRWAITIQFLPTVDAQCLFISECVFFCSYPLVMVPETPRAPMSVIGQATYSSSLPLYPLPAQMRNSEPEGSLIIWKAPTLLYYSDAMGSLEKTPDGEFQEVMTVCNNTHQDCGLNDCEARVQDMGCELPFNIKYQKTWTTSCGKLIVCVSNLQCKRWKLFHGLLISCCIFLFHCVAEAVSVFHWLFSGEHHQ